MSLETPEKGSSFDKLQLDARAADFRKRHICRNAAELLGRIKRVWLTGLRLSREGQHKP